MFTAYYVAVLTMWTKLAEFARAGKLADGGDMPPTMRTAILIHLPIVQALVTQGRALDASDIAGHIRIITQLEQQKDAFNDIVTRFGLLSTVSAVTTPPWTVLQRDWQYLQRNDPEMAALLKHNLPNIANPLVPVGIGFAAGLALTIGGIIALKYLTR